VEPHIGADAESGLVHSVIGAAAKANDVTQTGVLLRGDGGHAFAYLGNRCVDKPEEAQGQGRHVTMQRA